MNIINISVFKTNYIWILYNQFYECIIIDPGETINVLKTLKKLKLRLQAILLTHNHLDHVAGVYKLIQYFPKITVYGPEETQKNGANIIVSEGDEFVLLNKKFIVIDCPGHTKNHISFYYDNKFFCGDTVFSSGCGTVQPGLIKHMYQTFLKIKKLPNNTLIYSGHEYTLSNINWALSILPYDQNIITYRKQVINLYKLKKTSMPTTLSLELKINPFFRCNDINLKKALCLFPESDKEWEIFQKLRKNKDDFNKKLN